MTEDRLAARRHLLDSLSKAGAFRYHSAQMRPIFLTSALALAAPWPSAGAELKGTYECNYRGSWGCPGGPEDICVDSERRRSNAKRYELRVDFDSRRISLNGLDGRLETDRSSGGYWIYWRVVGLGKPKLSSEVQDGAQLIHLTDYHSDGGRSIGVFRCKR